MSSVACRPLCHSARPLSSRRVVRVAASNNASEGEVARRTALLGLATAASVALPQSADAASSEFASSASMDLLQRQGKFRLTDEEWRSKLSSGQYNILRKESTERPFASPLNKEYREGMFKCAGCATPIFPSTTKFDSGTGWPSFGAPVPNAVDEVPDYSIVFLPRTEVRCKNCQGHLGHVFNDGPRPTGLRYCMNGLAMTFEPATA